MAPSLPSCISSTFCSHRKASWFLLATLSPFFLPFLILCVPFLLLFLAPVSVFLFSLLLLYKVHVSMCPKLKHSHRRADKGEGYQPIAAAEKLDIHQQAPLEEDREFKCLEGSNVQSAETHTHLKEGDGVGVCLLPSRVFDFEEEKLGDLEEDLVAHDGITEDKIEEKQDFIEGPSVEEDREGRSPGGFPEYEGPEFYSVQHNVELPASSKARVEEGLQSTKREGNLTEETQEDMGKELLRNDRMEDNKHEEEEVTKEFIDFKDEQKHSLDSTSSCTSEENRTSFPMTYEGESLDTPYSYDHRSSVPIERQGQVSLEDQSERLESSHMHPLEEAWGELPAIQVTEPNFQARTTVFADQIIEKPWEGHLNEQLEIDTPFTEIGTHEHIGEEPGLSSEKDPSLEILGNTGRPDKNEDTFFPAEPFEKETEEGERGYTSPEGHGQRRMEAFSRDDEQPQKGRPDEHIGEEPGLSSEKDPSLEILGNKGRPDKNEDTFFPAEPFEKETEEGERGYSSPEGHGQWRMEAFSRDDEQPQKGRPAKNLAGSFEAVSSAEREEGYPSEATSSAVPPPHVSHGGIEFQDRIQEEQKIAADINSIKKIVGYQGEPHASILEQISALYMFLGMEPYDWGAEVDNLERAQAEIELLKVVVGVK